jgi:hypothetical protein
MISVGVLDEDRAITQGDASGRDVRYGNEESAVSASFPVC